MLRTSTRSADYRDDRLSLESERDIRKWIENAIKVCGKQEFFMKLASIGVWMRLAPLICGIVGVGLSLSLVGADKWEEPLWSQNEQLPSEIYVSWVLDEASEQSQSTAALSSVGIPQPQTTEPPVCSAI